VYDVPDEDVKTLILSLMIMYFTRVPSLDRKQKRTRKRTWCLPRQIKSFLRVEVLTKSSQVGKLSKAIKGTINISLPSVCIASNNFYESSMPWRSHLKWYSDLPQLGTIVMTWHNSTRKSYRRLTGMTYKIRDHCQLRGSMVISIRCVALKCIFDGTSMRHWQEKLTAVFDFPIPVFGVIVESKKSADYL